MLQNVTQIPAASVEAADDSEGESAADEDEEEDEELEPAPTRTELLRYAVQYLQQASAEQGTHDEVDNQQDEAPAQVQSLPKLSSAAELQYCSHANRSSLNLHATQCVVGWVCLDEPDQLSHLLSGYLAVTCSFVAIILDPCFETTALLHSVSCFEVGRTYSSTVFCSRGTHMPWLRRLLYHDALKQLLCCTASCAALHCITVQAAASAVSEAGRHTSPAPQSSHCSREHTESCCWRRRRPQ